MSNLIVQLERAEIAAFTDLYRAASDDVAAAAMLSVRSVAGATLLTASRIDVLAMNRLVGLGLQGTPADRDLDEVIAAISESGAPRAFVQVAPVNDADALASRLLDRGLRHYNNWMRLHRAAGDLAAAATDSSGPRVRQIGPELKADFGRIVSTAFGYPPSLAPVVEQVIGRPGWHHYLAMEDDTPIAAAAMFIEDTTAWFGFAATDQAHRRRGAQQALVRRRLADAAAHGCKWVSIETAEDTVTRDAPSFRNLRRLGFEVAYRRPNYLWTRDPTSQPDRL